MSTWWISADDLDDEQVRVIEEPDIENGFLLLGPPGSGKTNLLLLRARFMQFKGKPDFKVLVFTKQLRAFVRAGAERYEVDPGRVITSRQFLVRLLREHGRGIRFTGGFDADRGALAARAGELAGDEGLDQVVQVLFVDEVQDYEPGELSLYLKLAPIVIAAGDEKQTIYASSQAIATAKHLIPKHHHLKYHYRVGQAICEVADAIKVESSANYRPILEASKYDEGRMKSSVVPIHASSLDAQCQAIIEHLEGQLELYKGELIGVLAPRIGARNAFWNAIQKSRLRDSAALQNEDEDVMAKPILVSTVQSAKGLEFRAVHIVAAEEFASTGPQHKNLCYTAVTRAKTSLRIYHTKPLPGYLEAALATQLPPAGEVKASMLFGRGAKT